MYLVTKYVCGKGEAKIVGLFRGKENADRYIKEQSSPDVVYICDKVTTDFWFQWVRGSSVAMASALQADK